jgi:hypothetical protein
MAPVAAYIYYLGWNLLHDPASQQRFDGPPLLDPLLWGAIWAMVGGSLATLSVVHAIVLVYVGRCIARRRRRLFCLVFSIFDLTYAPLGTALGLFAIVLLSRPVVKAAFDASK